ncbi:MAG: sigma factor-like helix-turn-helix DNA-binding protein [Solirubrobacteraceae bacterium]
MTSNNDWLYDAWRTLPDRWDEIIAHRLAGETLDRVAETFDITRERIRQLQQKAEAALVDAQRQYAPLLPQQLNDVLTDHPAIPESELAALLPTRASVARQALFRQLGASHPRSWAGDLPSYWTRHPAALGTLLRKLTALAPMTDDETAVAVRELGFPADLPIEYLLKQPGSKLTHHPLGWIRAARTGRDLAYLWLRSEGEPRAVADVAAVTGTSEHAIRETMRRDDDFAQVRPEGTWALADWRLPGTDNRYSNAVDVVIDVLRELGPLNYEELRTESQRRYPVSSWRITQCLSSAAIGLDKDGRYDLAERGAIPIEDPEPAQPSSIRVHGDVVGIALNVDSEMLRGSGITINRWLTWYLELRTAPSSRYFEITDQPGVITVKRATSASQLSSLRTVALNMDLVEGCKIAVLLHLDTETATIRHMCTAETCPAT